MHNYCISFAHPRTKKHIHPRISYPLRTGRDCSFPLPHPSMRFHGQLLVLAARAAGGTDASSSVNNNYPGYIAPPPGVTANLDWEPKKLNIVAQSLWISLTTISVATRFLTKWYILKQIHLDDCQCIQLVDSLHLYP